MRVSHHPLSVVPVGEHVARICAWCCGRLGPLRRWVAVLALSLCWPALADKADKGADAGRPGQAGQAEAATASQVMATVNGVEITQGEVDHLYRRLGVSDDTPAMTAARKKAILADLVRAEAMTQQAVALGLEDADQQAMEWRMARRQWLASRVEREAGNKLEPLNPLVVQNFMERNPLLFAQRRQYTIEELQIRSPDPQLFRRLEEAITKSGFDLDRAQRFAVEAGATTQRRVIAIASDRLPQPLVVPLAGSRIGQLWVVQSGPDRGGVLAVRASVPAPLIGEGALQAATSVVQELRRRRAALARSDEILGKARITYTAAAEALSAAAAAAVVAQPPAVAASATVGAASAVARSSASGAALGTMAAASSPTDSAAVGSRGPVVVQPEVTLVELPRGRIESPRRILARKIAVGTAAVVGGLLAMLLLFAFVRYSYQRIWLPRLWRVQRPESTPSLLKIVAEAVLHPSTLKVSWFTRLQRWVLMLGVVGCGVAVAMAASAMARHLQPWMLGAGALFGWVAGIGLTYAFAQSQWRERTKNWRGMPVVVLQLMLLGLSASAVRWL